MFTVALTSVRLGSASAVFFFFFSFPWNEFIGFPRVSTLIKQRCCGNQHLRDLRRVESAAAARGCAEDGGKAARDEGAGIQPG